MISLKVRCFYVEISTPTNMRNVTLEILIIFCLQLSADIVPFPEAKDLQELARVLVH
jgi:hypothetical protein